MHSRGGGDGAAAGAADGAADGVACSCTDALTHCWALAAAAVGLSVGWYCCHRWQELAILLFF